MEQSQHVMINFYEDENENTKSERDNEIRQEPCILFQNTKVQEHLRAEIISRNNNIRRSKSYEDKGIKKRKLKRFKRKSLDIQISPTSVKSKLDLSFYNKLGTFEHKKMANLIKIQTEENRVKQ